MVRHGQKEDMTGRLPPVFPSSFLCSSRTNPPSSAIIPNPSFWPNREAKTRNGDSGRCPEWTTSPPRVWPISFLRSSMLF